MRFQFENEVFFEPGSPDEIVLHAFITPLREKFFSRCFERICPGVDPGSSVVPFKQLDSRGAAPALCPTIDQPLGMRIPQIWLFLAELREAPPGRVCFAREVSEDSINKPRLL